MIRQKPNHSVGRRFAAHQPTLKGPGPDKGGLLYRLVLSVHGDRVVCGGSPKVRTPTGVPAVGVGAGIDQKFPFLHPDEDRERVRVPVPVGRGHSQGTMIENQEGPLFGPNRRIAGFWKRNEAGNPVFSLRRKLKKRREGISVVPVSNRG